MSTTIDRPVVIELLVLEEVEAAVGAAENELATLQARARAARATAERLEAQLRAQGADPDTADWMVMRLRQFVEELLCEGEEEANLVVARARRIAAMRGGAEAPWVFGALAVRNDRMAPPLVVRWRAPEPALSVPPAPAVRAPAVTAAYPTVMGPTAPVVPDRIPGSARQTGPLEHLDAPADLDMATMSADGAPVSDPLGPHTERDFWPEPRDAAPFWRRRPRVTVASTLTVSAGIAVLAAIAVQLI
jgi:hypothetical protein